MKEISVESQKGVRHLDIENLRQASKAARRLGNRARRELGIYQLAHSLAATLKSNFLVEQNERLKQSAFKKAMSGREELAQALSVVLANHLLSDLPQSVVTKCYAADCRTRKSIQRSGGQHWSEGNIERELPIAIATVEYLSSLGAAIDYGALRWPKTLKIFNIVFNEGEHTGARKRLEQAEKRLRLLSRNATAANLQSYVRPGKMKENLETTLERSADMITEMRVPNWPFRSSVRRISRSRVRVFARGYSGNDSRKNEKKKSGRLPNASAPAKNNRFSLRIRFHR
jgi:hypothetical protein